MNTSIVIVTIGALLVCCAYVLLVRDPRHVYRGDRILRRMRKQLSRIHRIDTLVNVACIPLWLYFMVLFGTQMHRIVASDVAQLRGTKHYLASGALPLGCQYGRWHDAPDTELAAPSRWDARTGARIGGILPPLER